MVDARDACTANDKFGLGWGSRCIVITGLERPLARPSDGRLNDAPGG